MLRDFDAQRPPLDLSSVAEADGASEAESALELYEYPGGYTEPRLGNHRAKLHLERERARAERFTGTSICRRLCPGARSRSRITPHLNGEYVIVEVRHRGAQLDDAPAEGEGSRRALPERLRLRRGRTSRFAPSG